MLWCHDVVPWRHVTWWRGAVTSWRHAGTSYDVRCHDKLALCNSPIWNFGNHVFQPGDLDLWPWLIRDIIKVNASTKFRVCMSNGSAVRALTDTLTHTDGTDFIPSTADAGGNNNNGPYFTVDFTGRDYRRFFNIFKSKVRKQNLHYSCSLSSMCRSQFDIGTEVKKWSTAGLHL